MAGELTELQARVTLLEAQVIRVFATLIVITGITTALAVAVVLLVVGTL